MGYYIFSYAIDAEKVKSVIGTTNPDLFEAIVKSETFNDFAEQDSIFEGHTNIRQALEQLILGKRHSPSSKYNPDSPDTYWYAFIAICAFLGKEVPFTQEISFLHELDPMDDYLSSDFGVEVKMMEILLIGGDWFGLPEVQDWPMCGILFPFQLDLQSEIFSPVDIKKAELKRLAKEDNEKATAYTYIRGVKENIAYCLKKKLSLISFCH